MPAPTPPIRRALLRARSRTGRRAWAALAIALATGMVARPEVADAQQEFTRQAIFVNVFGGSDVRMGRSVANGLRSRLERHFSKRDISLLGSGEVAVLLDGSGIDPNRPLVGGSLSAVAQSLRADEILDGTVEATTGTVRLTGRLVLVRDERLVQPLGPVSAPTLEGALAAFFVQLADARRQLAPHRRCENALREGAPVRAVALARDGLGAARSSVIVRTCLVTALLQSGAPAAEVAQEADTILGVAPKSYWALDAAARARDALGDTARAADRWLQLAETDPGDLVLARRVATALLAGGNAGRARPFVERLSRESPDDVAMRRLAWQVHFTLRDWKAASASGERLQRVDDMSRADSTFVLRLATALQQAGEPVRALATASRGVLDFPGDARLYVLYSQLVQGESPVTIGRGIERFPQAADLQLLRAQELRKAGRAAEAVAPLQRALALDPALGQGFLQLAQTHAELGAADSALAAVRRALQAGEDSGSVARFALARGNVLLKSANESKQRGDFERALQYLALADSVRATPESGFLLGVTALTISQSAATDAPSSDDCSLARLAGMLLPIAREKLTFGARVAPDASRQYLDYLTQLEPIVARQQETLCQASSNHSPLGASR